MVKKHYIASKRIPDYCPLSIQPAIDREFDDENDAPPAIGVIVGYQYDGSDHVVSTIAEDAQRQEGSRVLDRLLYDGMLTQSRGKMALPEERGGEINVTQYGLVYRDEDAPRNRPTLKRGIPDPSSGQCRCKIVVEMSTVDESGNVFTRDVVITKSTPPTFKMTFMDLNVGVGQELVKKLYDKESGFRFATPEDATDEKGRCKVLFYNVDSLAAGREIEFDSVKDMLNSIVGVRLIEVTPVPKKGCRVLQ